MDRATQVNDGIEFDLRPSSAGPLRMGSCQPGAIISDWEPAVGDTASLHAEGVTIFTRITSAIDRQYKAEIIGFARWEAEYFKGKKAGDAVEFSYAQAFGFGRL